MTPQWKEASIRRSSGSWKSFGFHVKGEIGSCDLVGIVDGSPPVVVIGELKLTFNLDLGANVCDEVCLL